MSDAKVYWDQLYTEKPFQQGKAPNPFLVSMLPRLQQGKALDIGMGEGQNAVYLAQKGFQVRGFDISPVAIDHANQLAGDTGVSIEAKQADLDLYLMGLMEYDTIIMTRFKPSVSRYYNSIIAALKQGGVLLVDSYTTQEMDEPIPNNEEFRNHFFKSNEILRHLSGLRLLYYQEGRVDGHHVIQCLAQKPVDKDAARLNLFDMHSKSSDQEQSKHLEMAEKLFKK
jgi:cyclopropane fatty-acyl-phospholipid synthase-like methyltransferase